VARLSHLGSIRTRAETNRAWVFKNPLWAFRVFGTPGNSVWSSAVRKKSASVKRGTNVEGSVPYKPTHSTPFLESTASDEPTWCPTTIASKNVGSYPTYPAAWKYVNHEHIQRTVVLANNTGPSNHPHRFRKHRSQGEHRNRLVAKECKPISLYIDLQRASPPQDHVAVADE